MTSSSSSTQTNSQSKQQQHTVKQLIALTRGLTEEQGDDLLRSWQQLFAEAAEKDNFDLRFNAPQICDAFRNVIESSAGTQFCNSALKTLQKGAASIPEIKQKIAESRPFVEILTRLFTDKKLENNVQYAILLLDKVELLSSQRPGLLLIPAVPPRVLELAKELTQHGAIQILIQVLQSISLIDEQDRNAIIASAMSMLAVLLDPRVAKSSAPGKRYFPALFPTYVAPYLESTDIDVAISAHLCYQASFMCFMDDTTGHCAFTVPHTDSLLLNCYFLLHDVPRTAHLLKNKQKVGDILAMSLGNLQFAIGAHEDFTPRAKAIYQQVMDNGLPRLIFEATHHFDDRTLGAGLQFLWADWNSILDTKVKLRFSPAFAFAAQTLLDRLKKHSKWQNDPMVRDSYLYLTRLLPDLIQRATAACAKPSIDPYVCSWCGTRTEEESGRLKKCSICQAARYCNRECQVNHWKNGHSKVCKQPCTNAGHQSTIDAPQS